MTGYFVIRTYEAGAVGEKYKYFIPSEKGRRNERKMKANIRKQEQNDYAAEKRLARLINGNFGRDDFFVGFDYGEESYKSLSENVSGDEEERLFEIRKRAEAKANLCIRRARRKCEKAGIELKYILVTSDMDGDTGENVRVHHHLIVNGEAAEILFGEWKEGNVHKKPLRRQKDYTDLAEYLIRQARRSKNAKAYTRSRNLKVAKPRDRVVPSGAEIRLPKGAELIYRREYSRSTPQYIRYILPERTAGGMQPADTDDHAGGMEN